MLQLLLINLRKQIFKHALLFFPKLVVKWASRIFFNCSIFFLCYCRSPYWLDLVLCLEPMAGG